MSGNGRRKGGRVVCGAILAASLAAGAAQGATFTYGGALDASLGPLPISASASSPVSVNESETAIRGWGSWTSTIAAAANPGVVSALASVTSVDIIAGFPTARPEVSATMTGLVQVCGPGSTALSCIAPTVPIDIPAFNLLLESVIVKEKGASLNEPLALVTGTVRVGGTVAASAEHRSTSSTRLTPTVPLGTTTGAFFLQLAVLATANCAAKGCTALADASSSLKFVEGEDAFLGLPAGYTVFAPDFNIFDNRWIDPRKPVVPPGPTPDPGVIPLPAAGWLLLGGLGGLAALRRRR